MMVLGYQKAHSKSVWICLCVLAKLSSAGAYLRAYLRGPLRAISCGSFDDLKGIVAEPGWIPSACRLALESLVSSCEMLPCHCIC